MSAEKIKFIPKPVVPTSESTPRGGQLADALRTSGLQTARGKESKVTVDQILGIGRQQVGLPGEYTSPKAHNPLLEGTDDRADRSAERAAAMALSIRANAATEVDAIPTDADRLLAKLNDHLVEADRSNTIEAVPAFYAANEVAQTEPVTNTDGHEEAVKLTLRDLEETDGEIAVYVRPTKAKQLR
jgi:hypothetical protein